METYTFPQSSEVLNRLIEINNTGSDVLRIFTKFADDVGGQQLNAHGIKLSWELAVYDVASLHGAPPQLNMIAMLLWDDVVESFFANDLILADLLKLKD